MTPNSEESRTTTPDTRSPEPSMTACPGCGTNRTFPVAFTKNQIPIGRCESCGLGRAQVELFDPNEYYTESYFDGTHEDGYADYEGSAEVLRAEFRQTLDHLVSLGVSTGRLLEVGCAYGFFLDEAATRFEVSGVEIAAAAAESAKKRHPDVRTGPLDPNTLAGIAELDAVVLLDVIEHLEDPESAISICAERLKPGGLLLMTTGDWGALLARTLGPRWRLMTPPQHLWYFTRQSLGAIAGRFGLEEVSFSHPWKQVPLPLVAFQLQRMLFGRGKGVGWVPNLGIPINLFDAMRVVYRRA